MKYVDYSFFNCWDLLIYFNIINCSGSVWKWYNVIWDFFIYYFFLLIDFYYLKVSMGEWNVILFDKYSY